MKVKIILILIIIIASIIHSNNSMFSSDELLGSLELGYQIGYTD
jgi:hypothetical protein